MTSAWERAVILAAALLAAVLPAHAFEVNGVALTSWGYDGLKDPSGREALRWIRCLGATDVAIVTENAVDAATGRVYAPPGLVVPGPSLRDAVAHARSLGLRVTIKPHYQNSKTWDHLAYPPYQPPNMALFFDSLRASLLEHARLAEETGAVRLVLGTELGGHLTGPDWRFKWRGIIAEVRKVFHGSLTYSATIDTEWKRSTGANEAAFVSFWELVDEVGVNVYPKLTRAANPDVAELERAWRRNADGDDVVASVRAVAERTGKPVLFMEHGFRSLGGNYWETGSWGAKDNPTDDQAQVKLLEASLRLWQREGAGWLKGVFLWEIRATEPNPQTRDEWERGFIFRGKPAAETVRRQFGGGGSVMDAAGRPLACPPR